MNRLIIMFFFIVASNVMFAQSDPAAEKAIYASLQQMNNAWNRNDMNAYCNQLTEDGTWINVVGMFWTNKKDVIKAHLVFGESMFKYSTVSFDLLKLRFITPSVIIAYVNWASRTNQDYYFPDGKTIAAKNGDIEHSIMSLVFIKKNSHWLITSVTNTIIDTKAAPYDPVRGN